MEQANGDEVHGEKFFLTPPQSLGFFLAGALLWFCCQRRSKHQQLQGKLPSSSAAGDSPSWGGASAAAFIKRPFRKAPPKNLVASKAVDLNPPLLDPEQPSFTTGGDQATPTLGHTPAQIYTHRISVPRLGEAGPPHSKGSDTPVVGGVMGVQNDQQDKAGMAHSDSAVSLPSNASSVQGPGTPMAPAAVGTGQSAWLLPPSHRPCPHEGSAVHLTAYKGAF